MVIPAQAGILVYSYASGNPATMGFPFFLDSRFRGNDKTGWVFPSFWIPPFPGMTKMIKRSPHPANPSAGFWTARREVGCFIRLNSYGKRRHLG